MKLNHIEVHAAIQGNVNLCKYYNWMLKNSESLTLPYHNLSHTLGMMQHIVNIYKNSQYMFDEYGFKLKEEDLYILLLSAMFHDYNHTGGKFEDELNIKIAKKGLEKCINECIDANDVTKEYIINKCKETIDATQYPYVIKDEELNLYQRIIRECDILVCFYDDFITHNIVGIYKESYIEKMPFGEYVAKYLEFIFDSLKHLKLQYSKDVIEENSKEFFNNIDIFSKILLHN